MDKNLTQELLKVSLPDGVQILLNHYNDKFTLNLFLESFEQQKLAEYSGLLLKMTDADFIALINSYNELGWPLPTLNISENEHKYVRHFIRQIETYKVISSVNGMGNKQNTFMTLIYFDKELLKNFDTIDFTTDLSISDNLAGLKHLFNIIDKVKEYLSNAEKHPGEPQQVKNKPKKHTAKEYAVTYLLDCFATDKDPLLGQKTELEKIFHSEYTKGSPSGNTVYKNFSNLNNKPVKDEGAVNDLIGENWKEIVLNLSTNPDALKRYISEHYNV